jgi:polyisoprenoid-binding protein YceI
VSKSSIQSLFLVFLASSSLGNPARAASAKPIDTEKSVMSVHVFKAGIFSAFGHEHDVSAPIAEGTIDAEDPSVTLRVDARRMKVTDRDVSNEDRAKIQNTMLGPQVLDTERFAEINFKSTQIDRLGDSKWLVHGDLTLHGQTRPIVVRVEGQSGHYQGSAELKQKDFGITPVSAGGGSVKVKNEVRVKFDISAK